jgi:Icc-related predicted phosphoesterase
MRFLAIMVFAITAAGAEDEVMFGPYVQNVQTEEATVVWITAGRTVTLEGGEQPVSREDYQMHSVRFDHLEPDTEYTYTLDNGLKGKYRTAPLGSRNFRFIAYGDNRSQEDVHQQVVDQIRKQENISLVLNTGDLVRHGSVLDDWKSFFRVAGPLMAETFFVPCLGNHEDNASEYFDFFVLPGNEEHFSFNWGGVHFVALNTEAPDVPDGVDDSAEMSLWNSEIMWDYFAGQRKWLDEDLRRHYGADFFVVFFHVPFYDTKLSRREPQIEVRRAFADILDKHKVELVINGHTHNYQHHRKGTTHYVVTGGGGAPLYDIEDTLGPETEGVEIVKQEKTYHFCLIEMDGWRFRIQAIRADGSIIEEFAVESQAGSRLVDRRLDALGGLPWAGKAREKAGKH